MKIAYFILPFVKTFITNRIIFYKLQENKNEKNISMFDNFNRLEPTVQQFMITI